MRGTPSSLPCPWDPHSPETISSPTATSAKAPRRYLLMLSPSLSLASGVPWCGAGMGGGGPAGQGLWPCRRRSPSTSSSLLVQLPSSVGGPGEGQGDPQGGSAPRHCQHGPPQPVPWEGLTCYGVVRAGSRLSLGIGLLLLIAIRHAGLCGAIWGGHHPSPGVPTLLQVLWAQALRCHTSPRGEQDPSPSLLPGLPPACCSLSAGSGRGRQLCHWRPRLGRGREQR